MEKKNYDKVIKALQIVALIFMAAMVAVMLIVISQLIVAYIIELFGMFGVEKQPFSWRKVIGAIVAIIGVVVFKWK